MDPTQPIPDHEPVLARVGDVDITASMIRTPAGQFALRGSHWTITDKWIATQRIPQWAIIAAIVGFCFVAVFSLLFLLAKETVYQGALLVTVTNGADQYVARIPVTSQREIQEVYGRVNYVRSLASA
jgi:hypothetical protein